MNIQATLITLNAYNFHSKANQTYGKNAQFLQPSVNVLTFLEEKLFRIKFQIAIPK